MSRRTVHLPVAAQPSVDQYVEYARQAEALGYDRVWMPETWGRDAVSILAAIVEQTEDVGVGPSVWNVYSRSPALIGQTAATLQERSGGRVRVAVGPSGPAVIEGWHGAAFERPLRRTREAIEIARAVSRGEPVEYDGELFTLSGFRYRADPPATPIAFDAAGMGPKSVELAGRFGDGWHATMLTPAGLSDRLEDFERGLELADRGRVDARVTLSITACALEDGDRARRLAAQHLAFYVGAMGTFYREALSRQGHEEAATAIASAWANGDREGAIDAVPEALLDELGAAGSPTRARAALERFESIDGVDAVAVGFPRGAEPDEIEATLAALAPDSGR